MRASGGKTGGRLLLAAGAFTLVNDYLPGSEHLDLRVLNTLGVTAIALGLVALRLPWERLPLRAPLVLLAVALGLLSVSGTYGDVSPYSYAVYYVVVFVWVGLAQPPRTSFWVAPLAVVSYVVPFLVADDPPATAVGSVTVAVPVCVLVGETLARTVWRLRDSQDALAARVALVERLAASSGELGRDLDTASVRERLVACARGLYDAPLARLVVDGEVVAQDGSPGAGQVLGARCHDGLLEVELPAGRQVATEDEDVLRLLAVQGAAALVNARTHAAVVAQREHEEAVVDVLADGVLVLDGDGVVRQANQCAAVMLGVAREALLGAPAPIEVGPAGVALHATVGARRMETVATVLPETDERVVTLRDVSRQRALDEAKDLFLATTSHELRTPLTAIKGYVHVLQRRWEVLGDDRRREALATVAERTDALVALTDHLLLGARAGASRHSADTRPFDLGAEVQSSTARYEALSARHRLWVDVPAAPLIALGDASSVQHIVGQLVENAVKYSPDGGDVVVSARAEGAFAAVEVSDRGIGVPEGQEASLFTPFFQAGATNTREYGGVGLGLYIVRQLVEAQGGTVEARNRPDGGAVLRFTVPLAGTPPRPREG